MWLLCKKCPQSKENPWQDTRQNACDIDLSKTRFECHTCHSDEVVWILNPRYEEKSIGYWEVEKMSKLLKVEEWVDESDPRGRVRYDPRIYSLKLLPEGGRFVWLPYWITIQGKRRYGQYSQITSEDEFLELFTTALKSGIFNEKFVAELRRVLYPLG